MKLEQAYYTSCKSGLRSGMGFQFNAASDGLTPTTLQVLERIGLYVPPLSAPSRPTEDELARFPVALIFQPLPGGGAVVACSRYVGQDYSGRFGNYFTHFVLAPSPAADFRDVLPIELWRSKLWQSREAESKSLPALADLPAGGTVDPLAVWEFLSRSGRAARLPAMITAAEQALATRKRIVVVAPDEDVVAWVAAVTYALPRPLALAFSFTTYTKSPYQTDALLAGTTPDCDFRFAPHELEHQFSVFDFTGDRFSPCASPSRFARLVAGAYESGHAEAVAGFADFVERTAPATAASDMAVAFEAYGIVRGFLPATGALREVAGWCAAHVETFDPEAFDRVMAALTEGRAADPDALEASGALARAALADPQRARKLEAGLGRHLKWLVREAAVQSDVTALRSALAQPFPGAVAPLARPHLASWLQQARGGLDTARASVLLLLGERLGFFQEPHDLLRRVGEHLLGPALGDPAARESLVILAPGPAGRDVLEGLADYLASHVAESETFAPLAPLLGQAGIGPMLEEYALGRKAAGLYLRLMGARTGGGSRLARFQECLDALARHGMPPTPAFAGNGFDAVWGHGAPDEDESLRLVTGPARDLLAGTSIPSRLAQGLAASCDPRSATPKQEQLAAALAGIPGAAADADVAAVKRAFELTRESRGDVAAPEGFVDDALRVAAGLTAPMSDALREVAAGCLVRVTDRRAHGTLLGEACRGGGERFAMAYVRAVRGTLEQELVGRPARFARFYKAWGELEKHADDPAVRYLLGRGLPYVVERWSHRDLQEVTQALQDSPNARARWVAWLGQRRKPAGPKPTDGRNGGLLDWLFSLLGFRTK